MATLSFQGINKIYDNNVQAVFDFNLEVKDKEFIVFVGPSGCGKSTTLRMIAGLEDITSGQLFIDGVLVNNVVPKDRNIAMVFQSYALYPHMTVYDNMAFALKLRKVKMPVYEENGVVVALRKQNMETMSRIKRLNRIIKKKSEPAEALAERDALYDVIYENEKKISELLVQKKGINQVEIKEHQLVVKSIENEVKGINDKINKNEAKLDKLQSKVQEYDRKGDVDASRKAMQEIDDVKGVEMVLRDALIQKEKQLEDAKAELEHFMNDEVPMTVLRKHNRYEINLEVYKTARILDLTRYLFRKPAALSGGQRQRVALGRAIVRNPKVFLMDEPLSNLDAKLRVQMRSEISKIHESVGATTVYVTHDQTEAMTMASRIVVMKDGYIQQIGTPTEVYNDPNNIFVGGFIGSPAMNFIKGTVKGAYFIVPGRNEEEKEIKIKLGEKDKELLKGVEGEIYLGARPESIYLKDDVNNVHPTNALSLNCDFAELLGYELVLYTYVNGQKLILKTSIKSEVKTHDDIKVCLSEDALYFFDADGNRIR